MAFWFLLFLIALLIIAAPWWPHSRGWGYWPGGGAFILVLVWLFIIWIGWTAWYWPWQAPLTTLPGTQTTQPPVTGPNGTATTGTAPAK
jgi:hypothetical protein